MKKAPRWGCKKDEVRQCDFKQKPTQNRHGYQKTDFFKIRQGTTTSGKKFRKALRCKDKSKAVIKGARINLYPSGVNLYRTSRGIKRPEVWQTIEQEAQEEISGLSLTYEKTISISDESGTVRNIINYRTYTKIPAESDSKPSDQKENRSEETDTSKDIK